MGYDKGSYGSSKLVLPNSELLRENWIQSFKTAVTFYFCLKGSLVYGNPFYFFISIDCKKKKCSNLILWEIQKRQMLCKSQDFLMCCISKVFKDRTFFFLQLIVKRRSSELGYWTPTGPLFYTPLAVLMVFFYKLLLC